MLNVEPELIFVVTVHVVAIALGIGSTTSSAATCQPTHAVAVNKPHSLLDCAAACVTAQSMAVSAGRACELGSCMRSEV